MLLDQLHGVVDHNFVLLGLEENVVELVEHVLVEVSDLIPHHASVLEVLNILLLDVVAEILFTLFKLCELVDGVLNLELLELESLFQLLKLLFELIKGRLDLLF